jgi:HK97 family phage prohead protease
MNELERRDLSTDVRALIGKDGEPHIVGKSPVFSSLSEDLGGWREIIAPEAFDEVLPTADIRGRYDHDLVLGRTTNGTLALSREADGIAYDITINKNDQEAMAAYARVARGDVNGAMFMVAEGGDKWEKRPDGMVVRTVVKAAALLDVGPVPYPAYPASTANASIRSKIQELQQEPALAPSEDAAVRARQKARRRTLELIQK